MQKFILSSLSTIVVTALIGCGGGGSGTTDDSGGDPTQTGTGYYVDSAVQGVDYVCGNQNGITDALGKFLFQKGQSCTFSLAGVPLRTTSADDLVDGGEVIENDPKVARFLQSIDNDGNASNGIQIEPAILAVLTQALTAHSAGKVPTGTALDTVVTSVRDDVPTFEGRIKTAEEVTEHLTQTQTEITKELLAGKTFYATDGNGEYKEVTFNESVTSLVSVANGETNTRPIGINGNSIIITQNVNEGDTDTIKLLEVSNDYLLVSYQKNEIEQAKLRYYYDQTKAKAYYNSLVDGTDDVDLKELLVDNTYYLSVCDSYEENGQTVINNHVETLVFRTDGTVHDSWIEQGKVYSVTINYTITGDTVRAYGTNIEGKNFDILFTFIKEDSDGFYFEEDGDEDLYLYKSESKASDNLGSCSTTSSASNTPTKELTFSDDTLSGKTLVTYKDKDNGQPTGCWTFNSDKSLTAIFKKDGELKEYYSADANWHTIDEGKLTFITENPRSQIWELTAQEGEMFTYNNYWYDESNTLDDHDTRYFKVVSTCPTDELVDD